MGCGSSKTKDGILQQTKPINLSIVENKEELQEAQNLISLIIKIRNRIIYKYHRLIFLTGACLFYKPNISHCLKNIFYKISYDFKGNLNQNDFLYIEEPPYLSSELLDLKNESKDLLDQLLKFINELRGYKNILKEIDNNSPTLLFLIYENKSYISERNIERIHKAMDLFQQLLNMRQNIWNQYKAEIQLLIKNKDAYFTKINNIGKEAYEKNLNDIYEISFLQSNEEKRKKKNMYSSIEEAKHDWLEIMKNDFNIDLNFDEQCLIK